MKRTLATAVLIVTLAVLCVLGLGRMPSAQAALSDFRIQTLNCTLGGLSHIVITYPVTTPPAQPFVVGANTLTVNIFQPGNPTPTSYVVNSTILSPPPPGSVNPAIIYSVPPTGLVDLQVGPTAMQFPTPAVPPTAPTQVALTTTPLLGPGVTVTLTDAPGGTVLDTKACSPTTPGTTWFVSPQGFDMFPGGLFNTQCGPDLPVGTPPSATNLGPCLTIENALSYANDGDTIVVEPGNYEVCDTIEVSKLVTIRSGLSPTPVITAGKSLLHAFYGQTLFHVTAIGYPSVNSPNNIPTSLSSNGIAGKSVINSGYHTAINGLTLGGSSQSGAGAIYLDGDANTDVTNNVIGGQGFTNPAFTGIPCAQPQPFPPATPITPPVQKFESLGNAAGIILRASNNANIFNNAILGTTSFPFVDTLIPGATQTGFGIATSECLGLGIDTSDGAVISFNLIEKNSNAAIWFCSDGGGGHMINTNTIRDNGRGVLLRAITDTFVDSNAISNDLQDGIVLYDAASNNTIFRNVIESHRTSGAAGIRIGGFGAPYYPLQTEVNSNTLRRNWIGIVIAGARSTSGTGNIITAEALRTGILLQVGSISAPALTQPVDTIFLLNQIVSNGGCTAQAGCAVRLDSGVTTSATFTQDNFGLGVNTDVNTVLWHQLNDPSLGPIRASQPNWIPNFAKPCPGVGAPGATGFPIEGNTSTNTNTNSTTSNTTTNTSSSNTTTAQSTPTPTPGPLINDFLLDNAPCDALAISGLLSPGFTPPTTLAPNFCPVSPGALAAACRSGVAPGSISAPATNGFPPSSGAFTPPTFSNPTASSTPAAGSRPSSTSGTTTGPSGLLTSPTLSSGPAGGTTAYSPPCNYITVPSNVPPNTPAGQYLSLFQPSSNIFNAWLYNNSTHAFKALYFSNPSNPVDVGTISPGDIVVLCLSDNVTGPP
jgi:parallel beta-helix repeat protein